ncbi:hypothetical protein CANCADRAFT_32396 [Tortispora caseinolytica NRRL Y-17796]|uniref:Thioredoxin domain-containing protein n=1 Tax=Tortispora caseinolytica NRRL Y-17796 TaxID=767744 RepID=A0A1E4TBH3_9ASCO|nr:hypothetical protein CANCADRAFT_32396 [Tortispora caseinolytica NRRL Y-17796]
MRYDMRLIFWILQLTLVSAFGFSSEPEVEDPSTEITPDNYEELLMQMPGVWFIKHFSPTCSHCRALAPHWAEFANLVLSQNDDFGVKIGNINCLAYGDLCAEHEVRAYPDMSVFKNGIKWDQLASKGDNNAERLLRYYFKIKSALGDPLAKLKPSEIGDDVVEEYMSKVLSSSSGSQANNSTAGDADKEESQGVPAHATGEKLDAPDYSLAGTGNSEPDVDADGNTDDTSNLSNTKAAPDAANIGAAVPAPVTEFNPSADVDEASLAGSPNPSGISVQLTLKSFSENVAKSPDSKWLIAFYTKKCSAWNNIKDNWAQLARYTQGHLNVGHVDCSADKKLCKGINLSPCSSIMAFKGTENIALSLERQSSLPQKVLPENNGIVYEGFRSLSDLLYVAQRLVDSDITDVSYAQFAALEEIEPVIFLYFYDGNTTPEDFEYLDKLSFPVFEHARIVKTRDPDLIERFGTSQFPKLIAVKSGQVITFNSLGPRDIRSYDKVFAWMKANWIGLYPELTAINAKEILSGRTVVLAVLDRSDTENFNMTKIEMLSAAKEYSEYQAQEENSLKAEKRKRKNRKIKEAEDKDDDKALSDAKRIRVEVPPSPPVGFAWIDGLLWERWLKVTYGVTLRNKRPRVIIVRYDEGKYWDETQSGEPISASRSEVLDTLFAIMRSPPLLSPKSSVSRISTWFYLVQNWVLFHVKLSLFFLFCSIIFLYVHRKNRHQRGARSLALPAFETPTEGKID